MIGPPTVPPNCCHLSDGIYFPVVGFGANCVKGSRVAVASARPTKFNSDQQPLESGSGPGGRRFKSSLPDQSFQALERHFWFSVYIDGVEIVDGACIADFLGNVQ